MKRMVLLALPGVLVTLAAALLLRIADPGTLDQFARGWPAIMLAMVALFALRLHNTRIFSAGVLIAATYFAAHPALFSDQALVQALLATFVPTGLALLAFARDGAGNWARTRNHVLIAFAPLLAGAFFSAGNTERALETLGRQFIDPGYSDWSGLSQFALVACLAALVAAAVKWIITPRPVEAGLFWSVAFTANALAATPDAAARGLWVLAAAVVLLIALAETAYRMAFHDELTGLPGRRALQHATSALQAPYAIAIIDIDHFKSFNDEHGHDVGDQVLRMVASRLRAVTGGGTAYRSGGEEFTIVFPGLTKREAAEHVEVVRDVVANSRFALRKLPRPRQKQGVHARGRAANAQRSLQVTISVGVAGATQAGKPVESVIAAADQAMYRAKHQGRNRVVA